MFFFQKECVTSVGGLLYWSLHEICPALPVDVFQYIQHLFNRIRTISLSCSPPIFNISVATIFHERLFIASELILKLVNPSIFWIAEHGYLDYLWTKRFDNQMGSQKAVNKFLISCNLIGLLSVSFFCGTDFKLTN